MHPESHREHQTWIWWTLKVTTWRTGPTSVVRTGDTSLSDDELVLCDGLFGVRAVEDFLTGGEFAESFNLPFGHQLRPSDIAQHLSTILTFWDETRWAHPSPL